MRCLFLIFALLAAIPAIAQPAITPPERTITIQKGVTFDVLGFADDGQAIYLEAEVDQVNILALLLYYWPEAAATLPALLLLRRFIRVARVRQFPGEDHCRRCNYLLKNLPSLQCPECGIELTPRNRVPGRRRWPRLIVATGLLFAIAATYVLYNHRVLRTGRAGHWLEWRSMRLAKWAAEGKVTWITRHTTRDWLVFLARLDGGGMRKVCRIRFGEGRSPVHPVLSADRRFLFASSRTTNATDPDGVVQIDLASGRILRWFTAPNAVPAVSTEGTSRTLFIAGRSDDGRSGMLRAFDIQSGRRFHDLVDARPTPGFAMPTSDGDLLVVTANGGDIVRVWHPVTGEVSQSFVRAGRVCCLNAGILYEAGRDVSGLHITARDILARRQTNLLTLAPATPFGIAVGHDTLVVACGDRSRSTAFAFNLKTGARCQWSISRNTQPALSSDGHTLAIYGNGLWNPPASGPSLCDQVDIYTIPWK